MYKKRDNFKLDAGRLRKKGAVKSTDQKLCLFTIEFKFVRKRERFYGHDVLSRYLALSDSGRCSSSRKRRHISLTRSSGNQTVISWRACERNERHGIQRSPCNVSAVPLTYGKPTGTFFNVAGFTGEGDVYAKVIILTRAQKETLGTQST